MLYPMCIYKNLITLDTLDLITHKPTINAFFTHKVDRSQANIHCLQLPDTVLYKLYPFVVFNIMKKPLQDIKNGTLLKIC